MLELEGVNIKDLKSDKREFEFSRKNIELLSKHYGELTEKYGGSIVVISNGKVIGTLERKNIKENMEEFRRKFEELTANLEPAEKKTLLLTYIPRPDEVLIL